jgi:hypothetical protein
VRPNREGYNALGPNGNLLADEFAKVFFDDFNVRIDHQFSPSLKIYGSYTENRQNGLGRPINIKETAGEFDASQGRNAPFSNATFPPVRRGYCVRTSLTRAWVTSGVSISPKSQATAELGPETWIPNHHSASYPVSAARRRTASADTIYGIYGNAPNQTINETYRSAATLRSSMGHTPLSWVTRCCASG